MPPSHTKKRDSTSLISGSKIFTSPEYKYLNLELCKLNDDCPPQTLYRRMLCYRDLNHAFLKGKTFYANYHKKPFPIKPAFFSFSGANRLMAFKQHRSGTNVEQYLFVKHHVTLKYPFNPCVVQLDKKGNEYYFPIETLYYRDT